MPKPLSSVFTVLNLLRGQKSKRPDVVVIVQDKKLVIVCMTDKKYDIRPKSNSETPVTFTLAGGNTCELDLDGSEFAIVRIERNIEGDRIVMVNVEKGPTPRHVSIIVRIPKSLNGHVLSLNQQPQHNHGGLFDLMSGQLDGVRVIPVPLGMGSPFGSMPPGFSMDDIDDLGMIFGLGGLERGNDTSGQRPQRREPQSRKDRPTPQAKNGQNHTKPVGAGSTNGNGHAASDQS